ncbi:MAG: 30S ribosomal protein S12 methylthiotransferase RimO [Bacteroidales bacterium]|nr:30S ribosomal protein S12 methylthiotransferase RimO [Bacteroidales bacterium]
MSKKAIRLITLGCSKNTVDSEYLMTQLACQGFTVDAGDTFRGDPPTVIINTCGFINDAKQESIDTILEYARAKKSGLVDHLIVTGCLSQRYLEELKAEMPEVDAFFGVNRLKEVLGYIGAVYQPEVHQKRLTTTPSHYAYLKIAEGCDRRCSFCAIPMIRGKHTSVPVKDIVAEAIHLSGKGAGELLLISQDTGSYGKDLHDGTNLVTLLKSLVKVSGPEWIRLHYLYPSAILKDLLLLMKDEEKICKYVDVPVQHISDRILKSMHRGHSKKYICEAIGKIRSILPEAAIRTTVITGYPGETEKEFEELAGFIREVRFDRLGVFAYSHEDGTAAGKIRDNIPLKEKLRRLEFLMDLQQNISLELNMQKKGKIFKVLIDGQEGLFYTGRTEYDSPEVDNEVLIPATGTGVLTGNFCNVKITEADFFDLTGVIV